MIPVATLTPSVTAILSAQPGTCRYPVAEQDFRFCGEPVVTRVVDGVRRRLSYCARCSGLAFTSAGLRELKIEATQ